MPAAPQPVPTPVAAPAAAPVTNVVQLPPQASAAGVVKFDWAAAYQEATGFEHVKQDDLGLPFLIILQPKSPAVDKTDPDYATQKIEGAQAGDIINTLTRQIVYRDAGDETLDFVPCTYMKAYVEWKPREQGGGFVKQHSDAAILSECTRNDKGRDVYKNGNHIVTTAYFGGYILQEGQKPQQVIISMTSTQLKKARMMINMAMEKKLNGRVLPFYSHVYSISTTIEKNDKGSWYGWLIESGPMVEDPILIKECQACARQTVAPAIKEIAGPKGGDDDLPM